ncbi:MAG: pyrroloquinoline quinone biosynthesis peptide chaperone PqqD [Pseudomonadota bacterium]
MIDTSHKPALSRLFRMQWEPAQDAYVLLYPEGMVKLSQSAAEILKRCDGKNTADMIVTELEQAFSSTGLHDDIHAFLNEATTRGWFV